MGVQTWAAHHLIMKFLILVTIVSLVSAVPTCDECKSAIDAFHNHLLTEESMAEAIAILIAAGCPTQPDPAQCEADVAKYWPGIATATYGFFFTQKEPCGEMGLNVCKREWTCDDCTGALALLAGIMTQEEYVQEAITWTTVRKLSPKVLEWPLISSLSQLWRQP